MQGTPYDFFVQWHLTERCNLRCRHCYQQVPAEEMDYVATCQAINNIKSTIDSWVAEYGMKMSPSFHFTGGEPLLRKDLFTILDYTRQCGFSISLMSNGTLITKNIAQRLRRAQVQDVQISLEGLERIHDHIRGQGSFRRARRGIENLVSQGVDTHINLTLSRINLAEVEGLFHLARDLGVDTITYSRLVTCGQGKELAAEMLTPQELASFHERLRRFRDDKARVLSRDPLATVADAEGTMPETDFPVGGCAAGIFGITVASDGSIMPCRRMNLSIGNIKQDSFRELWAESPVLWSLRNREYYHGGCESCRYWAVCRGCRAVALAYARAHGEEDYLGPDPQCPYYQPRR